MTTWSKSSRDKRKLMRTASIGDTFYGTETVSRHVAPYEDGKLANRWTVTHMHPILGGPMCGSMPLEVVLQKHGPLTGHKPAGLRGLWERSPQVAGPVPDGYEADLDEAELLALQASVTRGSDPRKRGRVGTWRV